ncbi:MAG: hypothetical protein ACREAQ_06290 [Nitrososphaera sp.]
MFTQVRSSFGRVPLIRHLYTIESGKDSRPVFRRPDPFADVVSQSFPSGKPRDQESVGRTAAAWFLGSLDVLSPRPAPGSRDFSGLAFRM